MASRYRWRQQLLGSLQGQLQLATYLVVFLGFTEASSVSLLIDQRNLPLIPISRKGPEQGARPSSPHHHSA